MYANSPGFNSSSFTCPFHGMSNFCNYCGHAYCIPCAGGKCNQCFNSVVVSTGSNLNQYVTTITGGGGMYTKSAGLSTGAWFYSHIPPEDVQEIKEDLLPEDITPY